ncbi:hypothetical protein SEVIR_3G330345v4 [Setaria viridis]
MRGHTPRTMAIGRGTAAAGWAQGAEAAGCHAVLGCTATAGRVVPPLHTARSPAAGRCRPMSLDGPH